jgi:PAS domain S-box-containing protein
LEHLTSGETVEKNDFSLKIKNLEQQMGRLQQHSVENSLQPDDVLLESFEKLQHTLEELHIAGEELRQQNEELAAARLVAEAERQRYQELFDFAPDGYVVTDATGTIQEANRAIATLLAVSQDFLVGKPLVVFVADKDRTPFHVQLTRLTGLQRFEDWEVYLQPREGKPFPAAITIMRDPEDKLIGLRWLIRDITKRKEAEEALKASETRYRRLFESAKDGILLLDADTGQITDVNPYLIKMLGYSHNEFLGKKLWEIGLFKHIAENQAGLKKLQRGKYIRYEHLPLETKEGRHVDVEFVSNVYLEDHQKVIQCNIRNITERKRAEEELKKHEEHLEELVKERTKRIRELEGQRVEIEKWAGMGQMAAQIAHEINNPLAGIKNSFSLVKDAVSEDHPYYAYVGRIETEINRIARIVRQMFDLYRPEQDVKNEFPIDRSIHNVVTLLEAAWRENNITIEIDSKPITMEMPEGLLRQVLYNILLNAIEASPQGGVIKIMTEVDNEILTLLISDQGVGIPLEVQSRIFEPFFTSKHGSQKGLGLGLSVSKDIVEKLGGHIGFESEPGKGTLFRIILPLKSGERR